MQNKANLRHTLLAERDTLAADVRTHNDFAIGKHLISWLNTHPTRTMAVYWPIRNEPDLRLIYPEIAACGVRLALPVVEEKNAPMKFRAWVPGDQLVKDRTGVPTAAETNMEVRPDVVLVPCVGFNDAMIRLGYGGGYYDRTLARQPRPVAVGIAYQCAKVAFDAASHDVALDAVITEISILSL